MRKDEVKTNPKNEKVKHAYYKYAKYAKKFSDKTIECHKKSIYAYEEFTKYEDFALFNADKAIEFRESLLNRINPSTGKAIALSTVYDYMRYLKTFFTWLSTQTGYKSKIKADHIEYLGLSREQEEIATAPSREKYPTIEQVQKVVNSIEIQNELDLRDRALISFTLLSGMRDNAIITLPLGCFDPESFEIYQTPKKNVKTKFSKTIQSYFFPFDKKMVEYVLEWYQHLKKEKLFSIDDPLFPRNKVENAENTKTFISNSVEPIFWESAGSMREIFKARFEHASVEYFPPHSFRHTANHLAKKQCKNFEQFQAVSQNFGHSNMGTTFSSYGKLPAYKVKDIVSGMNFSEANHNPANYDLQDYQEFQKFQEFKRMQNVG